MAISVVIPAAPWPELLWRLELVLEGLAVQTCRPEEVILVDSIGQGDTRVAQLAEQFADRLPIRAYQMPPHRDGLIFRAGSARNYGVERLQVPVPRYLFLDADCVPDSTLVMQHDSYQTRQVLLSNARRHVLPEQLPERTLTAVLRAKSHVADARLQKPELLGTAFGIMACALSVPADLFAKVGGFWTRMIIEEDYELAMRMIRAGGRVRFCRKPDVVHVDHPRWRPMPETPKPAWAFTYQQSLRLPGYLRIPL